MVVAGVSCDGSDNYLLSFSEDTDPDPVRLFWRRADHLGVLVLFGIVYA